MKIGKYDCDLLYNANAYFDIKEAHGNDITEAMYSTDDSGKIQVDGTQYKNICHILSILIVQAELWRRCEGQDKKDIPSLTYIKTHLKPFEVYPIIGKIMNAVSTGMKQETEEDEEVDLGLLELQKKTVE